MARPAGKFLGQLSRLFVEVKCGQPYFPTGHTLMQWHVRHMSDLKTKAAVLKEFCKPLVIEEVKDAAKLAKEEVRVAVHCCAVNSSDILLCNNEYNRGNLKPPFVPGFEMAGEILEIGKGVTSFKIGDRVLVLNKEKHGGFSDHCVAPAKDVWTLPPELDFMKAASLVDSYTTAYLGLVRRAAIDDKSTVLITAAAGGLGLAAVDLAANVYQAKVIGVCGTEDKAALVREKGAWMALSYHHKGMVKAVNEVTDGRGVSVVFDAVGGELFHNCLECVAHEGTVIVAGFASRQIPTIQTDLLLPRSVSLAGISLSHYRDANPELYRQVVGEVIEMGANEDVEPHISATFSLDQVNEALQFVADRKSTGKVVINLK